MAQIGQQGLAVTYEGRFHEGSLLWEGREGEEVGQLSAEGRDGQVQGKEMS